MSATSGQPLPRAQVLFEGDRAKRKPELVPRLATDAVAELVQRLVVSMTATAAAYWVTAAAMGRNDDGSQTTPIHTLTRSVETDEPEI